MVGVVILPEKTFEKLKNLNKQSVICFVSALIVGFLSHMYKISNWLPNWDSIVFRYDAQNMTGLGRWFLSVVSSMTSFYDLPFLNGVIAILLYAFGAVCIIKMFDVKSNITAAIVGATIISFPAVTSTLMYNYVADAYGVAFLLSCLAAYFLTKEKTRYIIIAIIFIALSSGIYQAYITVTIMLVLCYLISRAVFEKENTKSLIKKSLKYIFAGAMGEILYYGILLAILKISGTELLDYQGASSFSLADMNIRASVYLSLYEFFEYFFDFSKGISIFSLLNIVIVSFTGILYVYSMIKNKVYAKMPLLLVLFLALPFGASVLLFINSDVIYHNLMKMGYAVFYIFFILLYEKIEIKREDIKRWVILIISVILILNQVVIANVSYHKAQMAYEKSYGTLIRIADRAEKAEDGEKCEKLLVIGALENSKNYFSNLPPEITGITDGYILRADDESVGQSVLCSALNDYCGKNYKFLSGEEKQELLKKEEIKNMGVWPSNDSVKKVDGILIIKLGSEL